MLYLAIHHHPFHKCLTRISLPFGLKSSHPRDGKHTDSLRVRQGQKRAHTQIHIPFVMARQKGVFARTAATRVAQRKQSIQQKRVFIFFVGANRSSD